MGAEGPAKAQLAGSSWQPGQHAQHAQRAHKAQQAQQVAQRAQRLKEEGAPTWRLVRPELAKALSTSLSLTRPYCVRLLAML